MNNVEVRVTDVEEPPDPEIIREYCQKILDDRGIDNWEISVVLCSNAFIRDLNRRFRGVNEPTDILSFPQDDDCPVGRDDSSQHMYIAGDLVLSLEQAHIHALRYGNGVERELKRLLIHGILHLIGYDHTEYSFEDHSLNQPMLRLEHDILQRLGERKIGS